MEQAEDARRVAVIKRSEGRLVAMRDTLHQLKVGRAHRCLQSPEREFAN
jgi:hypothetical protein